LHKENRDLSQDKLIALIATKLGTPTLKRPSVTRILKESAKWLSIENSAASKTVRPRKKMRRRMPVLIFRRLPQHPLSVSCNSKAL
jgi:hypothetical protein